MSKQHVPPTILDGMFPLGIGTNRFNVKGPDDKEGIERCALLVAKAIDAGVCYIDVAHSYSGGMAETICARAFKMTDAPKFVTVKSSFLTDRTADDAVSRIENTLQGLDLERASFFVIWNISSLEQFAEIMRPGALYEGALKARARGLIDHICFSSHAPTADLVKIIESGAFEAATICVSALNGSIVKPALDALVVIRRWVCAAGGVESIFPTSANPPNCQSPQESL